MGKALQIRVTAVTWNEDLLEQLWPQLSELAFSVPIKHENHGVLEMVRALDEGLQFLPWSQARRAALGPGIHEAARIKAALEAALADPDLFTRDPAAFTRTTGRLAALEEEQTALLLRWEAVEQRLQELGELSG